MTVRSISLAALLSLAACAAPREAKTVGTPEPENLLVHRLDIDTMRIARGAADGQWTVAGLVERHLATVGMVRPGRTEADVINLVAELPPPGYALRARIEPRPEQFCRLQLEVISTTDDRPVAVAPWWAIDALERVNAGVGSLRAPQQPALDELRFARFHSQAAALARDGQDPPITMNGYIHAPRRLNAGAPEAYFAPPTGPSVWLPNRE